MGAATCWQLAKRGQKVLGLERFDIPNAMGSSGGDSRMILGYSQLLLEEHGASLTARRATISSA